MIARIPDPELFLRFVELDGSTEGKRPQPIEWFRDELVRRGILGADGGTGADGPDRVASSPRTA
jgi:hypothetical protein